MSAEQGLTLWDLVKKNVRVLSPEEIAEKKRHRSAATIAQENRAALADELGGTSADAGVLDLFAGPQTNTQSQTPTPTTAESEDIFSTDFFQPQQEAPQGRDEFFELSVEAGGSKLPPFKGAYRYTAPRSWSAESEIKLYALVEQYGEDCMVLSALLPAYTFKEINRKLHLERKRNRKKLQDVLSKKRKLTLETFESERGPIDPSTHWRPRAEEVALNLAHRARSSGSSNEAKHNVFEDLFGGAKEDDTKIEGREAVAPVEEIDDAIFG